MSCTDPISDPLVITIRDGRIDSIVSEIDSSQPIVVIDFDIDDVEEYDRLEVPQGEDGETEPALVVALAPSPAIDEPLSKFVRHFAEENYTPA